MTRAFLLLLLAGCGASSVGVGDPNDPYTQDPLCAFNPWYPDVDGDGYGDEARLVRQCARPEPDWIPTGGDCDDTRSDVRPDAAELANGVDDDCDGAPDDGTALADDDGDGACDDPIGPCSDGAIPGDCADDDPARFPGAEEACNGLDDDCDGDLPPNELDGDSDGFIACAECDDTRADASPGATEVCNGRDDDCNRIADDLDADGDGAMGCPGTTGLDVLVVLDNSASMGAVHRALANQAEPLLGPMERARIAWRVGVLAADDAASLLAPALEPAFAGTRAAFNTMVRPTEASMDAERGLQNAVAFLGTTAGRAFRRPGAGLAVIYVSDEDDRSRFLPEEAVAALRGELDAFALGAVGGGWTGCTGARGPATPSPRLVATAEAAGGPFASVCGDGWFLGWGTDWLPRNVADCDDADPAIHGHARERCNTLDDDCDGVADDDHDGDGFTTCDGDCSDRNARRAPGLTELCDGVDNDCVGGPPTDEDDRDGDGWRVCENDCDDLDRFVNPDAAEICGDGTDQDCDGTDVPDDVDADGDGYTVCGGDCDDDDDLRFPWAPEHPFSDVDEDCDGFTDGYDPDVVTPLTGLGPSSLVRVAGRDGVLFNLCGQDWPEARISVDGYVIPGTRVFFEDRPLLADLRTQAPLVAAAWGDLDPTAWTGGSFLAGHPEPAPMWIVQRPGNVFSVVWDEVPDAETGVPVRAVATIHDGAVDLAVARLGRTAVVGAACSTATSGFVRLPETGGAMCLGGFESGAVGAFVTPDGAPATATSSCTP